ncbi:hypothetical protein HAX54_006400 [Datura stramonium]|uniref:Uncharacterized protein n=1 Tax=Datura stramonium TaxID=4076 RepID=A0ABS8WX43_DATST|nr:hypothetical protein [Datura stramonium]
MRWAPLVKEPCPCNVLWCGNSMPYSQLLIALAQTYQSTFGVIFSGLGWWILNKVLGKNPPEAEFKAKDVDGNRRVHPSDNVSDMTYHQALVVSFILDHVLVNMREQGHIKKKRSIDMNREDRNDDGVSRGGAGPSRLSSRLECIKANMTATRELLGGL